VNGGALTAAKVYRVAFVGCRRAPLPTAKRGTPHDQLSLCYNALSGAPRFTLVLFHNKSELSRFNCPPPYNEQWDPPRSTVPLLQRVVGGLTIHPRPFPQQLGASRFNCPPPYNKPWVPPQSIVPLPSTRCASPHNRIQSDALTFRVRVNFDRVLLKIYGAV